MIAINFARLGIWRARLIVVALSFIAIAASSVGSSTLSVINPMFFLSNNIIKSDFVIFASVRAVVPIS